MTKKLKSRSVCLTMMAIFLLLLNYASSILIAQPFPKPPIPWRDDYNISLKGFKFSHPMTVLNQADLEKVKIRIANNIEPQKSAYSKLLEEAETQLHFIPDAPETMNIMGGYEPNSNLSEMREWLWRNCHAAYTCALAYTMANDERYAEKAREILMNWANTGTTFTGDDRGLQLGSWFSPMLYAADLIHSYSRWSALERSIFTMWWKRNCLNSGDVLDVMRRKDNNWKDAGVLGVMTAAVVLEDTLLLKEALIQLKSYFFSRTDEFVQLPGPGWKIKKDERGTYLPREVVRNDGSSGLTYTAYALTTMVQCFEIARYAGFDFWHMQTEEGATIADVINQYYAWDRKGVNFPWHRSPNRTDKRRNSYELANTFLHIDPELTQWVEANWPLLNGQEGDEYCSLNKGDLMGTGIVPPQAPDALSAVAVSDRQIELTWNDNSADEIGFIIQRKSGVSSYFTLGKVDADVTSFTDQLFLLPNTTYTYRIQAFRGAANSAYSNEASATTFERETGLNDASQMNNHPDAIQLFQNYPNPFNPTTIIRFQLSAASPAQLDVYNLRGEQVKSLLKNSLSPGLHEVQWDGTDNLGLLVSAGVYFYCLKAGNYVVQKKMLYLK
ncbi:MAG: alginate lyase family protein [Bacteroidales bacterium]|nr:alginate lyase family protein [Bacteroidales bacterium]